jgi:glycosyltransferase involved in cell wall biosynthesis
LQGDAHNVADPQRPARPRVAIVVSFLNEAEFLPRLLGSLERQTEPPEQLLLVDDGSSDQSFAIAQRFAEASGYARALRRPPRSVREDRLADAPELQAFTWGVERLEPGWDVLTKVDGDLELPPTLLAEARDAFLDDGQLGITGSYLSILDPSGMLVHEHSPPYHVRGASKFYRRECYEQIVPLPVLPAWDTIDDLRARRLGWATRSFVPSSGEPLHLRPTGAYDGRLRAGRRWGRSAWQYGAHPLWVALSAMRRATKRPYGLVGLNYVYGWCASAVRRSPRADAAVIAQCHSEDLTRIREAITALWRGRGRIPSPRTEPRAR